MFEEETTHAITEVFARSALLGVTPPPRSSWSRPSIT
jgi:hypothetical protein